MHLVIFKIYILCIYIGILGNENADALAKKGSTATYRPVTKSVYYSVKRFIKSTYLDFNKQNLITQSQGKKWNSLHHNPQLIRKSSVAAFRLATGHDCLPKHLHRIGIYQSPNCPLCNSNQEMNSEHLKIFMDAIETESGIDQMAAQHDDRNEEDKPLCKEENFLEIYVNEIKVEPPDLNCYHGSHIKCEENEDPISIPVQKFETEEESCNVDIMKEEMIPGKVEADDSWTERSTGFLNMCSHNVVSTGCNKLPLCILCYFKMNDVIDNPADCEVRSVIRFLNARHLKPAEIYRQLKEVYGDTVMNERNVRKWCEMFNNGRTNVHDETRPGCPSLITEDLKTKVNDRILQDRRTSFDELHIAFPDISRSLLGEIVSQHLGYHKICARWVPRQLSDQHKTQRMASALTFLMRYHTDGDAFLDQIVTGDETWVSHNTPETKRQSRQWHHPSSPKKPRKFKQTFTTQKVMATVFWDRKGVLLLDFMPKGTTINANRYCETLRKLRRAIQNKRRGMLSRGVVLLHDNARPHTAASTRELLDQFGWEIFDHPPYSPDLAPSDFHLFIKLKDFLGGTRFGSDELKKTVNTWLNELVAEEYNTGILKLVNRYDKCLNVGGDYVEKSVELLYEEDVRSEENELCKKSIEQSDNMITYMRTQLQTQQNFGFQANLSAERDLVCDPGSKVCSSPQLSKEHRLVHSVQKPFKCEICQKSFTRLQQLRRHAVSHKIDKPFKCDICEKNFGHQLELKKHALTHTEDKPFKCNLCDKSFTRIDNLRTHATTHTGLKPFKCDMCDMSFARPFYLRIHSLTHTDNKPFKCNICEKSFAQLHRLQRHIETHKDDKPFKCNVCGKNFRLQQHLKNHAITHTGGKDFKCEFCGKSFSRLDNLRTHEATHSGQKPFKCGICGKNFLRVDNLRTHSLLHTDDRPFKCKYCDKSFTRPAHLRRHTLSHTGDRPFKCEVCDKSFTHVEYLQSHAASHRVDKPFKCEMCDKSFARLSNLQQHTRFIDKVPKQICLFWNFILVNLEYFATLAVDVSNSSDIVKNMAEQVSGEVCVENDCVIEGLLKVPFNRRTYNEKVEIVKMERPTPELNLSMDVKEKHREYTRHFTLTSYGKQELAFRGHNESVESDNRGNYIEYLSSLSEFDHLLANHLESSTVFRGTSPAIQNDLIFAISGVMIKNIKSEIEEAPFVAIVVDETSDCSNQSQLSTVLRYVNSTANVQERFIGFTNVSLGKTAVAWFQHVEGVTAEYNVGNKLIAQT
ncbi:hypothetical protein ANN_00203 [Periplaneta americana]|uniref:C2H2-type domain-containing protein n=1 Tax=Periplaneta americana TaxID=6978 RepID=A0ABQ8TQA6_PERAM|nr:hypothetical protein ANN_00203 [Periplaneta americana]